jgi:putative membrane protein
MKMTNYLWNTLKGIAMGAADVVPGVSGGTIAFMTGIYEELITSIKSLDHRSLALLIKGEFKNFWGYVNGNFLLAVFSGVLLSILTLARLMEFLLVNYPVFIWSFFFGLIMASAIFIIKKIEGWKFSLYITFLGGIVFAVWISLMSPSDSSDQLWTVLISGMIAICAMILPGISGSFILLLLGKYEFMMSAIKNFDFTVILVFGTGAVVGLILFSHILSWLLKRFYYQTITLLAGFMTGSLVKVWPWKLTSTSYEGIDYPVFPGIYENTTGLDSFFGYALFFVIVGFSLVFVIEFIAKSMKK